MSSSDVIIVGGGIVGLATAYDLAHKYPDIHITLLEKEADLAFHQTGRNSGVLHSGIYYKPGSLKARNCRQGKALMQAFCDEQDIPYQICGKIIVATNEAERPVLHDILARGQANGVQCKLINQAELQELEAHTAGIEAIHVPEAGIIDYKVVCRRLADILLELGHEIIFNAEVIAIRETAGEVTAVTTSGDYSAGYLVNCGGLQSDRVTKMGGVDAQAQIVPFRGEYFKLKPEAEYLCHSLIYPVPDPSLPFSGRSLHIDDRRLRRMWSQCGPCFCA